MRKLNTILIILFFLSVESWSQYAEDAVEIMNNMYGFGARSSAMGTAYTGIADDYSAIYWNPAGLAQIRRMEFYGEISHLTYKNDALFYNSAFSASDNFTKLNALGMVFPVPTFRGSLVFALGFQRVKDFDQILSFQGFNPNSNDLDFEIGDTSGVDIYPFDRNVQQRENINQDGSLNNWSFAGAIDVSPNVSLGATFSIWSGRADYTFNFLQEDINNLYNVFPSDFASYNVSQRIISEFSAFQIKFGALMRPHPIIRVGLNIALPTTFNIVEEFSDQDELIFDDGFVDSGSGEPGEFEYDVNTPFQFSLGVGVDIKNLVISGAFEYIDLSQVEFEIPGDASLDSDYDELLDENLRIRELYEGQLKLKIGAEYTIPVYGLKLRGGYFNVPSALINAASNSDKQFYTAGIGIEVDKQVTFDVAYISGSWNRVSSDSYTPGGTQEDINYQKLFFTTSFRF